MGKVKISKPYRIWIYSIFSLIWLSGLTFFVLKTWFIVEGDFGPVKHFLQFPALQIHGAAAFLMMITYGYFISAHVQTAWKIKPIRTFGLMLVICPAFLIITGYLLYYIAQDFSRIVIEYAHFGVGFILPFILIAHVMRRKKTSRIRKLRAQRNES